MSHELDHSKGKAAIAYRGEKPWHGLGQTIEDGDDVATITRKAGLDFTIERGDLLIRKPDGSLIEASPALNRSGYYRSDTGAPLSIMSRDFFNVHQPSEIVGFIDEACRAMGWKIETAGALKGGRKVWALAKIAGAVASIGKGDEIEGYLLAATACDGSMASEFLQTSVRTVCQNTLHMALAEKNGEKPRVKVYHYDTLNADTIANIKKQLGVAQSTWERFIKQARALASMKMSDQRATSILRKVYDTTPEKEVVDGERVSDADFVKKSPAARKVLELFQGDAIGAELASVRGTAWGLVNATTEYYDHVGLTKNADNRLSSAWFGTGASRKQEVVDAILATA